jgi:serine/threonine protein phosphatase PrpC
MVDDWMIREIMTSGETLEVVAANLIRAANANGGADNITVIALAILAEDPDALGDPTVQPTQPGY